MVCDHIETAEKGRRCEICRAQQKGETLCSSCHTVLEDLHNLQLSQGHGNSLIHVLTSLQNWAKDLPAWEVIQGMDLLTRPINQRFVRPEQQRIAAIIAPFVAIEGPHSAGKASCRRYFLMVVETGFCCTDLDLSE